MPSWPAFDTLTVDPIGDGITTTISRPTMHNGQRFKVRVTVPANLKEKLYLVVLRAVVSPDNFNQLPVTLWVK